MSQLLTAGLIAKLKVQVYRVDHKYRAKGHELKLLFQIIPFYILT